MSAMLHDWRHKVEHHRGVQQSKPIAWASILPELSMTASFHIGFPLFAQVTPLDLVGPQEILSRLPGAQCHLIAHDTQPVPTATGISLMPTLRYEDAPQLDMLCVPGGPGHLAAMQDKVLIDFLCQQAPGCRYVTSVCTGALVL